jgi:hypothetical protein
MHPILPFADPDPLVGSVLPSGLRVLERLGPTTLGALYHAQYPSGPPVALTLLDAPLRPGHQLRRACEIRHPNVASVVEVGVTSDGLTYVVGEYLTGELLSDRLAARGAPPQEEAVGICLQAAAGLQEAHRIGIVHGNVSPRTLLLTTQSGDDRPLVKLIRFNLDWDAEGKRGLPDGVDLPYTSPERLTGSAPDERGDVFSLGAVLHHLLGGAPPGDQRARGSMAPALRLVVDRALAPAPDSRYPTVAAFAEALASAGRSAGRPRPAQSRHRRLLVATIGAAVLAVVIWLAWGRHWIEGAGARAAREIATRAGDDVGLAPTRASPPDTATPRRTATAPTSSRPPVKRRERQPARSPVPEAPARVVPPSAPATRADSASQAAVSPFRRAHPWAAYPDGRFYFPSSCPLALQSRELLYFRSETEAQATGRSRATDAGCS